MKSSWWCEPNLGQPPSVSYDINGIYQAKWLRSVFIVLSTHTIWNFMGISVHRHYHVFCSSPISNQTSLPLADQLAVKSLLSWSATGSMWVRIQFSLHCYYVLTTEFDFFIPPAYPDSSEPPIFVLNNKARIMEWDEANATLSEASVMHIYLEERSMLMY